jgi:PII-like signaling protein
MRIETDGLQLCVYLRETMQHEHKLLYQVIMDLAHREGLAGTTVMRGIEGYGMDHRLHTSRLVDISYDLPVVVEIIDTAEAIRRFVPLLDGVVSLGIATLSPVRLVKSSSEGTVA